MLAFQLCFLFPYQDTLKTITGCFPFFRTVCFANYARQNKWHERSGESISKAREFIGKIILIFVRTQKRFITDYVETSVLNKKKTSIRHKESEKALRPLNKIPNAQRTSTNFNYESIGVNFAVVMAKVKRFVLLG